MSGAAKNINPGVGKPIHTHPTDINRSSSSAFIGKDNASYRRIGDIYHRIDTNGKTTKITEEDYNQAKKAADN